MRSRGVAPHKARSPALGNEHFQWLWITLACLKLRSRGIEALCLATLEPESIFLFGLFNF